MNPYFSDTKYGAILHKRQHSRKKHYYRILDATEPEKTEIQKMKKKLKKLNKEMSVDLDKINFKIRSKGILEKYNYIIFKVSKLFNMFDTICDFIEKMNKLLTWQDYKTSLVFLLILIGIFVVVTFLPIRFLLVLVSKYMRILTCIVLKAYKKGTHYYEKKYWNNKEACKIELRNFFNHNGIYKLQDMLQFENRWLYTPWSILQRKQEKKLSIYLEQILDVFLPENYMETYACPNELIEAVAYLNNPLKLRVTDDNVWELRHNKRLIKKKTSPIAMISNLVMNNIPSLIYVNKHKLLIPKHAPSQSHTHYTSLH